MPRWYAVYCQRYGKPEKTFDAVSTLVKNYDLGRVVTRISFEKRAPRNGEFYYALGIESDTPGLLPSSIVDWQDWQKMPMLGGITRNDDNSIKVFTQDELRWMTNTEVRDYARKLVFTRTGELGPDDPFADPQEYVESLSEDGLLDRALQNDRLLTWMSAMGSGSLAQFRAACVALRLSSPQDGSSRILRRLRVLGHVETSPDGRRWSVAPTALVHDGIHPDRMFLAGARDAALLSTLRMYGDVEETPMGRGDAPSHVTVHLGDARMVEFVDALRPLDAGRAGERIANVLPDLDGWAATLQRVAGVLPDMFDLKQYDGTTFIDVPSASDDGLYAFYESSSAGFAEREPKFTLYRDHMTGHWLRGDWYGLRYLAEARRRGASGLPVRFDPATGRLAVLQEHRWPELFERAVVLASGRLPAVNGPWLIHDGVSRTLLDRLTARLNLDVIESDGELPHA